MAWKVIKGKKLTPDIPQPQDKIASPIAPSPTPQTPAIPQDDEGYGLLGRLGLAAGSGLEGLISLLSAPGVRPSDVERFKQIMQLPVDQRAGAALQFSPSDFLRFLPEAGPITQLSETAGTPQGFLEAWGQRFLKQAPTALPMSLLGPLGVAESALLLGTGSGAGAGLQALGAPGIVQDLGQAATEIGAGMITGRIPTLRGRQQAAYTAARQTVPTGVARTAPVAIQKALSNVEAKLATETNPTIESTIRHAMGKISSNIEKVQEGLIDGAINPEKALDLRRSINRDIRKLPQDYFSYLKELKDGINNFFSHYSAENPAFYEHLTRADQYTELKNMRSILQDRSEQLLKFYPKAGKVADLLKEVVFAPPERFLRRLLNPKNSLGRQHYFNMVKSTSTPTLFLQEATQLKNILDQEKQEEVKYKALQEKKKEAPAVPQWKVIRGSKLQ